MSTSSVVFHTIFSSTSIPLVKISEQDLKESDATAANHNALEAEAKIALETGLVYRTPPEVDSFFGTDLRIYDDSYPGVIPPNGIKNLEYFSIVRFYHQIASGVSKTIHIEKREGFLRCIKECILKLLTRTEGRKLLFSFSELKPMRIKEATAEHPDNRSDDRFDPKDQVIYINLKTEIKFPLLITLAHEAIHASNFFKDPKAFDLRCCTPYFLFDNEEERLTITGSIDSIRIPICENSIRTAFDLPLRKDHKGQGETVNFIDNPTLYLSLLLDSQENFPAALGEYLKIASERVISFTKDYYFELVLVETTKFASLNSFKHVLRLGSILNYQDYLKVPLNNRKVSEVLTHYFFNTIRNGDLEAIDEFIQINKEIPFTSLTYRGNPLIEHAIKEAIKGGRFSVLMRLASLGADLAKNFIDADGNNLAHLIAKNHCEGHAVRLLRQVIEAGVNPWALNNNRSTPLHEGIYCQHVDAVEFLSSIANEEQLNQRNLYGMPPIAIACSVYGVENLSCFQTLVKTGKIGLPILEGNTLLHILVRGFHLQYSPCILPMHTIAVKKLQKLGLDINAKNNDKYNHLFGRSPLFEAAMNADLAIFKWLIQLDGIDLKTTDPQERTVLHALMLNLSLFNESSKLVTVIEELIKRGVNCRAKDSRLKTFIEYCENEPLRKLLMESSVISDSLV